MTKHRNKAARSGKVSSRRPGAGNLKEQLRRLPSDQLIEIVEKFLARLGEKQRLEFLNLLPSVESQDLEIHLPYRSDEDFLADIEDFFDRVRGEEFVEYGAGYDPEEGAHHYFDALRSLYKGSELAERIIQGFAEYRYIGQKPPQAQELFPEGGEVIDLLEAALLKKPSHDDDRTILSALDLSAPVHRSGRSRSAIT